MEVSGYGLALGMVPVEQDAAYWEWHVRLSEGRGGGSRARRSTTKTTKTTTTTTKTTTTRGKEDGKDEEGDDDDDDGSFHDVGVEDDDACDDDDDDDDEEEDDTCDPYALKFGVATRKDRAFYGRILSDDVSDTTSSEFDDGTALMRPVSRLRHGDVIGVAVQQSDLPMIQILHNGEPLPDCTITRFRGTVYPAIYIPPGAGGDVGYGGGDGGKVYARERLEDVDGDDDDDDDDNDGGNGSRGDGRTSRGNPPPALSIYAEFDEENFREMSPHARFGPLLAARGII